MSAIKNFVSHQSSPPNKPVCICSRKARCNLIDMKDTHLDHLFQILEG